MGKIIDLSVDLYDGAPGMAMDPKISISWHCTLESLGYNLSRVVMSTHQGTHIDAPKHFFHEGRTIDALPLEKFIVPGVKVDLTGKKDNEPILPEDVEPYADRITEGCAVLLETGWSKLPQDDHFFSDFPFVTQELAQWLVDHKVGIIGMESPTPNTKAWKVVHEILLGNETLVVEGLCNLDAITADKFTFYALPLKFKGRDGSPIRAIAIEE